MAKKICQKVETMVPKKFQQKVQKYAQMKKNSKFKHDLSAFFQKKKSAKIPNWNQKHFPKKITKK